MVPGTSLVYNPGSNQIINTAGGIIGSATTPAGSVSFSISTMMPFVIGGVLLLVLVSALKK